MWSSTTNKAEATSTAAAASDNKKKEEVDDCRCSSAAVDAARSGSGGKQQQLNTFDNSKTQTSIFAGNLTGDLDDEAEVARKKELEFGEADETIDSGFISGPQTTSSNIFSEDDEDEAAGAVGGEEAQTKKFKQYNIAPPSPPAQKQQEEEENFALDSGCIAEYDDDEDDFEAEQQLQANEQARKQVHSELSNAAVAAAATAAAAATTTSNSNNNEGTPMIIKNVDAGMSEWFCNLSLQTDASATSNPQQQQQQQQQVAAGSSGINNLNSGAASGARRAATSTTTSAAASATVSATGANSQIRNRQQQQQAAGNTAGSPTTNTNTNTTSSHTKATTTSITLTPTNAWEQFYQQNDDGDTPLHLACISGFVDVVAALIRMAPHPCLFNLQNDEAQTPLHLAALTAQPKILRMLLIAGAEPTVRDRHGNTALHLACISGEEQCVRALIMSISASEINEGHRQYGHRSNDKQVSMLSCARLPSDLEIRNYDGERCVHLAAQAGHIEILRILVLYGADINAREGKSGRTPLHIAIEGCNEDLANFLLDECQKLNLETETYGGLTAYQVACILNKSEMQDILEKRGAEPLTPPDSDYDSSDIETDLEDSKLYDRFGDPGYFVGYNGGNCMTVA